MNDNDVHSPNFVSKIDEYFTAAYREDAWGKYRRWDNALARSALATTRPRRKTSKLWTQGICGTRLVCDENRIKLQEEGGKRWP